MTPEEFRKAERRKMRLQADIAARRNSLMTVVPHLIPRSAGVVPRPADLPGRAAADASSHQNQADILGTPGINLNAENARRIAATTAHNNTMRPGRIADANARLLPKRGFSQGALDSLHEPPQQPPTIVDGIPVYPGAKNAGVPGNRSWLGQYLPDSWRQRNFNQQARDEQTHGEGQRFRGDSTSPWVTSRSTYPTAPRFAKSAAGSMVDSIKSIAKKKAVIAGSVALVGGDPRAADRYEAKALASLGIYAGQYALSNLDDADFRSKNALLKKLSPFMSVSDIATVFNMGLVPDVKGFVDLYNHKTNDVWTGRIDSPEFVKKIKTGDWHKSESKKTVDSDLMKRNIEALKISNQERDDLRSSLDIPLAAIHQTEDSYNKVKVTAKGGRITKDEADNAKEQLKGSGLTAEQLGRGIRDIALINSYQRMIDDATVREGDVRLQQSAASLSEKIGIFFKQVQEGELLSQPQRNEMQSIASDFYNAQINSYFPEIMDAREFLIGKYETSGVPQLTKAAAELDFTQIVSKRLYEKWGENYETNLESVESMLSGDSVAEPTLTLTADQFRQLQAEAEAENLSLIEYLELKELDELKRQQQ